MNHLGLACNLLISIGGRPKIAYASSVLDYKGENIPKPDGILKNVHMRL
jgi:Ferritin-like